MMDCDCPICQMMASESFGPSIRSFDGHSLDMDDDFAFSIHPTREAWEAQQREFEEMDAQIKADLKLKEERGEDAEDPFDSPWKSTFIAEESIPGDRFGHFSTAFQVAELVGWLKTAKAEQSEIDMLNAAFRDYRTAALPSQRVISAESFKNVLEQLAAKYGELTGRAADLQSRIDERQRAHANCDDDLDDCDDSDMPF